VNFIPDIFARNIQKPERTIFLFSDLIIVTKIGKKKRHAVEQIFNLCKMRFEELKHLSREQLVLFLLLGFSPFSLPS